MHLTTMKTFLIGLASAMLVASCQKEVAPPVKTDTASLPETEAQPKFPPLSKQEGAIVASSNDFAFRLFLALRKGQQAQNLFISPFSVSSALTMTFNGANGATKEAMRQTLGFGQLTDEQINQSYKSLQQLLSSRDNTVAYSSANAIWYDQKFVLQPPFVQQNKAFFDATIQGLDFQDPGAINVINDWVKAKTQGKIDKVVEEIRPDQVMFLINALYFKASWTYPFNELLTRKRTFRKEDGTTPSVDFMFMSGGKFLYYEQPGKKLIDLPYGNGQFSMTFIVPQDQYTVSDLAGELNSSNLATWLTQADTSRLQVRLPKFTMEYEKELRQVLTQLGMEEAFSDHADLSRMVTGAAGSMKISGVMHKTFVGVNEKGTEAAAVTGVGTIPASDPPSIHVDRPFIFLIREKSSNVILFIGQLMNP